MSASNSPFAFLVMCGFFFFLINQSEKKIYIPNLLNLIIVCVLNPLFSRFIFFLCCSFAFF